MAKKKPDIEARVLTPSEYPASITAPSFPGAHPPKVIFAAQHPLGLYHVEDEGADVHGVYFTPRRAKKARRFATASSMASAFRRISDHEDELVHPEAEREEGEARPRDARRADRRRAGPWTRARTPLVLAGLRDDGHRSRRRAVRRRPQAHGEAVTETPPITRRQREVLDHLSNRRAFSRENASTVFGGDTRVADKLAAVGAINKRYDGKHGELYWIRSEGEPATGQRVPAGFIVILNKDLKTPSGKSENFFLARAPYDGKGDSFRSLLRGWMTALDLRVTCSATRTSR
jgi:hypothetical protein